MTLIRYGCPTIFLSVTSPATAQTPFTHLQPKARVIIFQNGPKDHSSQARIVSREGNTLSVGQWLTFLGLPTQTHLQPIGPDPLYGHRSDWRWLSGSALNSCGKMWFGWVTGLKGSWGKFWEQPRILGIQWYLHQWINLWKSFFCWWLVFCLIGRNIFELLEGSLW